MSPAIEARLRRLERQAERPLSELSNEELSNEELEAELHAAEIALMTSYGSVEAVAAALRQHSDEETMLFLAKHQGRTHADPRH